MQVPGSVAPAYRCGYERRSLLGGLEVGVSLERAKRSRGGLHKSFFSYLCARLARKGSLSAEKGAEGGLANVKNIVPLRSPRVKRRQRGAERFFEGVLGMFFRALANVKNVVPLRSPKRKQRGEAIGPISPEGERGAKGS